MQRMISFYLDFTERGGGGYIIFIFTDNWSWENLYNLLRTIKFDSCDTEIQLQLENFSDSMPQLCPPHHWGTETKWKKMCTRHRCDFRCVWTVSLSSFLGCRLRWHQSLPPGGLPGRRTPAWKGFTQGLTRAKHQDHCCLTSVQRCPFDHILDGDNNCILVLRVKLSSIRKNLLFTLKSLKRNICYAITIKIHEHILFVSLRLFPESGGACRATRPQRHRSNLVRLQGSWILATTWDLNVRSPVLDVLDVSFLPKLFSKNLCSISYFPQ